MHAFVQLFIRKWLTGYIIGLMEIRNRFCIKIHLIMCRSRPIKGVYFASEPNANISLYILSGTHIGELQYVFRELYIVYTCTGEDVLTAHIWGLFGCVLFWLLIAGTWSLTQLNSDISMSTYSLSIIIIIMGKKKTSVKMFNYFHLNNLIYKLRKHFFAVYAQCLIVKYYISWYKGTVHHHFELSPNVLFGNGDASSS